MVKYAAKREAHGMSGTPLWEVWNQMLQRCYNKATKVYRWYGARGVVVCEEWKSFTAFHAWAITNGYEEGLTIDRKESDGNYEPSNCQWITQAENTRKSRNTHWWVTAFGETKTVGQWIADPRCKCRKESGLRMRLSRGWEPERAITTPSRDYPTT